MNGLVTGLTTALLALAQRLAPGERREWAEAMRAEMAYLPSAARLRWAFGCVVAAIKLRFTPMQTGSLRINPWLMTVESLVCFGSTTAIWWVANFGSMGVLTHDLAGFERYLVGVLREPDAQRVIWALYGYAVCSLVGPVGMFLGLRYALLRRGLRNRVMGYALVAAAIAMSLIGTLSTFWIGKGDWSERIPLIVQFTILPAAGILHLMYLGRPAAPAPGDARLTPA
jgi:hypothetical protein